MTELLVATHLGLGDALVQNGLVRVLAKANDKVVFPCKHGYFGTIQQLFSDVSNVRVLRLAHDGAEADDELRELAREAERTHYRTLRLGMYSREKFEREKWSTEFYRQSRVPEKERWAEFKLPRFSKDEYPPPAGDYIFVHDDIARKAIIPRDRVTPGRLVRPDKNRSNILDYCALIEQAAEVHCIDSCFAILADYLTKPEIRRVRHYYCKPTIPPVYRQKWEILR